MDIFQKKNARTLLQGKKILFIGDSVLRSIYQDLLSLLETGDLAKEDDLKKKGTQIYSYMRDKLQPGTGEITPGRDYSEIRVYKHHDIEITFFFTTRCYRDTVDKFIGDLHTNMLDPDFIIVLSCIWDVSRWGPQGSDLYLSNASQLLQTVQSHFEAAKLIWLTCPPISPTVEGAVLVEDIKHLQEQFRFIVLEANKAVALRVIAGGYDVIDLHFYCLTQIARRMEDGIHWTSPALRYQTNLILTHMSIMCYKKLPNNWGGFANTSLDDTIRRAKTADTKRPTVQKEDTRTMYGNNQKSLQEQKRLISDDYYSSFEKGADNFCELSPKSPTRSSSFCRAQDTLVLAPFVASPSSRIRIDYDYVT